MTDIRAEYGPHAGELSSAVLADVVPPTAAALDDGARYLVTWDDGFYIGSQGYGLVSDLEREGFDVCVPNTWRVPVTHHRVCEVGEVDGEIKLAVGVYVERWRAVPEARELAASDPRDDEQRAEYEQLRDDVRRREGGAFDIRAFHSRALGLGGVGLDTLRGALAG